VVGTVSAAQGTKTVIVHKRQIGKGAVTAKAPAGGAVHPKAIAPGAVTEAVNKPGAVTGRAIASDSIGA